MNSHSGVCWASLNEIPKAGDLSTRKEIIINLGLIWNKTCIFLSTWYGSPITSGKREKKKLCKIPSKWSDRQHQWLGSETKSFQWTEISMHVLTLQRMQKKASETGFQDFHLTFGFMYRCDGSKTKSFRGHIFETAEE